MKWRVQVWYTPGGGAGTDHPPIAWHWETLEAETEEEARSLALLDYEHEQPCGVVVVTRDTALFRDRELHQVLERLARSMDYLYAPPVDTQLRRYMPCDACDAITTVPLHVVATTCDDCLTRCDCGLAAYQHQGACAPLPDIPWPRVPLDNLPRFCPVHSEPLVCPRCREWHSGSPIRRGFATLDPVTQTICTDEGRPAVYYCASSCCPGRPYPASLMRHPSPCGEGR